jgi:predicted nucleotidyltransferase
MDEVFTTFATSRFVEGERVIRRLRECALRLIEEHEDVMAVHLFGSFAAGSATPRSDADIVIEIEKKHPDVIDIARRIFEKSPVAVELFFLTRSEFQEPRGIAVEAKGKGIVLAQR